METVNKLYLELSQVATAKTARTGTEDLLTSARAIAQRGGEATAWDRFDAAVARAGVGSVTAKVFGGAAERRLTTEITGERSESALIDLLCVAQH